jgi:hypothetical protein
MRITQSPACRCCPEIDVEFDTVFEVTEEGALIERPDLYAPMLLENELDSDKWRLWSHGYTGQYGYRGPIMHNSEILAGGIAKDLLDEPGVYTVLVSHYEPYDELDGYDVEGWAVAQLK